jgi:hypothetical protein
VLKLDPDGVYQWHTFYGAVDTDVGMSLVLDASGNTFVTGYSSASWNGPGGESPLHAHSGGIDDLFVLAVSSEGAYQWHTFLGNGSGSTWGTSVAREASGALYVSGFSDNSWNGPSGESPRNAFFGTGNWETCVVALDSDGAYQWHTFYGGSGYDSGKAIAVSATGDVVVVGFTMSSWSGPSSESPLHAYSGEYESFILSLDTNGDYQWHTFYGSANGDQLNSVAIDGDGDIYATGDSTTAWIGPGGESPIHAYTGSDNSNIVILALDSSGAYQWHTFFGSSPYNAGNGIVSGGSGNLFVTGVSGSWNGPSGEDPLHAHSGGDSDLFVLGLTESGAYAWHTFYGSSYVTNAYAITADGTGGLFVAGWSSTSWLGPSGEDPLHAHSGGDGDLVVLGLGI